MEINKCYPCSQVLAISVKAQLLNFCDTNKMIVPNQSEIKENHYCGPVGISNDLITAFDCDN